LRKHYAELSDGALMAVDPSELEELARAFYDEEVERRGLSKDDVLPVVSMVPAGPVSQQLRDVKRAALVACIAMVLGVVIPMWNSTRQMLALESNIGMLGVIAAILVGYAFTAIVPLFCFALFRNEGDLLVSRNRQWLALAAAAGIGILAVAAIPGWSGSFRGGSALDSGARPWTIIDTSTALGQVANLAYILLLVALSRLAGDRSSERGIAVSSLLRLFTKIAVIAGGIVAVACVVGVAATPWLYSYIRGRSLEMGYSNARWTLSQFALDRVRTALTVISVYVAPFLVWRGSQARGASDYNST
jgi:hypothetical protein